MLKTSDGRKVDLDDLISGTVKDVLTGEGMLDFVRDNIANALAPLEKSNEDFRRDLLTSIDKGFEKQKPQDKGLLIGRVMRALAACRMDPARAAVYAREKWGDERVSKALSSSEGSAGGFLLREEVGDLIELLRPASVVRSLGPVIVPMEGGTIRMPKHTAGASGGWIGENANIPMTEPGFGSVALHAKKYASLVPVSNDLLRRASPQADMLVRDDLVADIATSTDLGFIRGAGTDAMPKGLRYQAAAAGVNVRAGNGNATLAEITGDLVGMIQRMGDSNVRMIRMGWLMEWRTWARLMSIRDGNGNLTFAPEMRGGTLWGYPFRVTSSIPRGLTGGGGGSNETEFYLVDFADVMVGETTGILIDTSGEAAYHNGTTVIAAFSQDQTVIRAIVEVDLAVRHPESVQVLVGVDWAPADTGA
jgi:HK97 family phage major capsid protein